MTQDFSAFLEVRVIPDDADHVDALLLGAGVDIETRVEFETEVIFRMLSDDADASVSEWIERVGNAAPPDLIWKIKNETAPGRSLCLSVMLLGWDGEPLVLSPEAMEYLRDAWLRLEIGVT